MISENRFNNIITEGNFQEEASNAMKVISDSLAQSVGYYGSTTIIEDAIMGHKITKDGFTILQSLKFSHEYPIANTILKFIKDSISHMVS